MTLLCVPITVLDLAPALADAELAKAKGATIVEYRIDECFSGSGDESETQLVVDLVAASPLPCIVTCRPTWEGGAYDGPEDERVSLLEKLGTADSPPAYIDFELKAYTGSANIRQKINLAVQHENQQRDVRTRLILSSHDFEGRPADLTRRLSAAYAEPACAVVKVAFRARSLRDNLELFEILREAPKPTIALGMGEFGLMSRVLAPKFGGFLTFASLKDEATTAPGQPTIDDLLNLYRFKSIGKATKLYGVIGWPVAHSMSPLIHNAGFEAVGHDGVYLPMPINAGENPDARRTSFKATLTELLADSALDLDGLSVTIPFKEDLVATATSLGLERTDGLEAANTVVCRDRTIVNTDGLGITGPIGVARGRRVAIIGAGGAAIAAAHALEAGGAHIKIFNRSAERATLLVSQLERAEAAGLDALPNARADVYINCTPVGMTGGPAPDASPIPIEDMIHIDETTVVFDTVYNPIETPMLKAARARGCQTIDGVQMFVKQAAAQFALWTGEKAPVSLFDRIVREKLGGPGA